MRQMTDMHLFQANITPDRQSNLNPVQWNQALGMARKLCADIFQEGGCPQDAVHAFGNTRIGQDGSHWGQAINLIAFAICSQPRTALH